MRKILPLLLGLCLHLIISPAAAAKDKKHKHKHALEDDKEPWTCVKNGKIIKVKGKDDREKQDRCEEQFGIWEKKRHAVQRAK